MLIRGLVWHPFLFGVYPILFLYAYNVDFTPFEDILKPLAVTLVGTAVLFAVFGALWRDFHKAGALVSGWLILFFSYGHVHRAIDAVVSVRHLYLSTLWATLGVALLIGVRTRGGSLGRFTGLLNVLSAVLVAMPVVTATRAVVAAQVVEREELSGAARGERAGHGPASPLSDIYYIILDGYAHERTLKKVYGFDNSSFLQYLRDRSFYVGARSVSNYASTFLSLASSLNLKYVNELAETVGKDSRDRSVPHTMIQRNRLMPILSRSGYTVAHFPSGWAVTNSSPEGVDITVTCSQWTEFDAVLLGTTLLRKFRDRLLRESTRERVLCTFAELAEIRGQVDGPLFAFAHITSPHWPYVFGRAGEEVVEESKWSNRRGYINQLVFLNRQLVDLIDSLLSQEGPRPIIILQADHGSASWETMRPRPSDTLVRERMRILNAYLLPDRMARHLYETISPVNTFRLILRQYFGQDYELLPDRSYYSTYEVPYRFTDVTDIARDEGAPGSRSAEPNKPTVPH